MPEARDGAGQSFGNEMNGHGTLRKASQVSEHVDAALGMTAAEPTSRAPVLQLSGGRKIRGEASAGVVVDVAVDEVTHKKDSGVSLGSPDAPTEETRCVELTSDVKRADRSVGAPRYSRTVVYGQEREEG